MNEHTAKEGGSAARGATQYVLGGDIPAAATGAPRLTGSGNTASKAPDVFFTSNSGTKVLAREFKTTDGTTWKQIARPIEQGLVQLGQANAKSKDIVLQVSSEMSNASIKEGIEKLTTRFKANTIKAAAKGDEDAIEQVNNWKDVTVRVVSPSGEVRTTRQVVTEADIQQVLRQSND